MRALLELQLLAEAINLEFQRCHVLLRLVLSELK